MTHLELMKDVYYVGNVDFEVRNLHGYSTHRSSFYNAYITLPEDLHFKEIVDKLI